MVRPMGPGGALLRSSRLFSLPTPISPPPSDASSATATSAFPTRQTVTTTPESRKVGDWGFKHPLPLKTTTKSSTPYIRVAQVSAPESVTTFRSAADHTLTLEKFTEMKIPVLQPRIRANVAIRAEPPRSVFEPSYDFTHVDDKEPDNKHNAAVLARRWKFSGPWLAGMTSGSFERYLDRTVRDPKHRFRFQRFLRQTLVTKLNQDMCRDNLRDGIETKEYMLIREQDVTEDQMINYLRELRADMPHMYHLIGRFLDLAPMTPTTSDRNSSYGVSDLSANPYAAMGPPRTHPSTGISYIRTSAFMENHALHGPQANHAAIQARILVPGRNGATPRIGLGGFVARTIDHSMLQKSTGHNPASETSGLFSFDRNSKGGAKIWTVNPTANVRPSGAISVVVNKASDDTALNARELRGENVTVQRQRRRLMMNQPIRRPNTNTTSGYAWLPRMPQRQ